MFVLVLSIVVAALVAVFATQNTALITLHFGNYMLAGIPIYGVIIATLLFGFLVAWLISLLNDVSNGVVMYGKDRNIDHANNTITSLQKKIFDLQKENERIQAETHVAHQETQAVQNEEVTPTLHHNFFDNLRHSFR